MFQLLKQDKVSSGSGDIKPSQLEIASVEIDTEDIFEFLQVNNWCCRRVLLTVSTFDEQLFALPNMR
jgi:DNA-directed RNA polymerase subunit N (RpoN/RPB10)